MKVKVKICGLKTRAEAEDAVEAGSDLVGLNFVSDSKRFIDVKTAKRLSRQLERRVEVVGLFRDESKSKILEILDSVPLDRVQFHGRESPEFVSHFSVPTIKAIAGADLRTARMYPDSLILVDHPADVPGDGREWEWSGVTSILEEGFSVILAGGLSPENIEAALSCFQKVLPWGVDVASGVELDGRKDLDRMKAFVDSIRALEREL